MTPQQRIDKAVAVKEMLFRSPGWLAVKADLDADLREGFEAFVANTPLSDQAKAAVTANRYFIELTQAILRDGDLAREEIAAEEAAKAQTESLDLSKQAYEQEIAKLTA